jgi:hypothetical protein
MPFPLDSLPFCWGLRCPSPSLRAGSHRPFGPIRNDKNFCGRAAGLKACPSRPCPLPNPEGWATGTAYNNQMRQPIRVDNSRPVTVYDTARILGVSKKRTEAIIREVERTIHRDAKTGEVVIRTKGWENTPGNHSSRNGRKTSKTASASRKASR